MGKLGIFDDERKRWIQFDEDTEVLLRFIGREELKGLQRKAEKTAALASLDARDILATRLGRASVLGWRKMDDHEHPGLVVDGEPLRFSQENVDMLMSRSTEFVRFVDTHSVNSRLFLEQEKEEADSKNA